MKIQIKLMMALTMATMLVTNLMGRARTNLAERKESGEVPGWVYIAGATVVLCGIIYAALKPFIDSQIAKITSGN